MSRHAPALTSVNNVLSSVIMRTTGRGLSRPEPFGRWGRTGQKEEEMKKVVLGILVVVAVLLLAGCAPGVNELHNTPDPHGTIAGFGRGLWNGLISPVTFIISLFTEKVQMYEVHNNGGWYNFGFILGAMIIFGGGGRGSRQARKRRNT